MGKSSTVRGKYHDQQNQQDAGNTSQTISHKTSSKDATSRLRVLADALLLSSPLLLAADSKTIFDESLSDCLETDEGGSIESINTFQLGWSRQPLPLLLFIDKPLTAVKLGPVQDMRSELIPELSLYMLRVESCTPIDAESLRTVLLPILSDELLIRYITVNSDISG